MKSTLAGSVAAEWTIVNALATQIHVDESQRVEEASLWLYVGTE